MRLQNKKMQMQNFRNAILEGIQSKLPSAKEYDFSANHAPKRRAIVNIRSFAVRRVGAGNIVVVAP